MARRGPQKTPAELDNLRGNPGKRGKRETVGSPSMPAKPRHLSKVAAKAWDDLIPDLHELGLLRKVDRFALEMLVETYAQWREARRLVDDHGPIQELGKHGYTTLSGYAVLERQARKDFYTMAERYGMTATGRTGLSIRLEDEGAKSLRAEQDRKIREAKQRRAAAAARKN